MELYALKITIGIGLNKTYWKVSRIGAQKKG